MQRAYSRRQWLGTTGAAAIAAACAGGTAAAAEGNRLDIEHEPFGTMPDGTPVLLFTLANTNGMRVRLTNYGGIVTSLETPDREGNPADIVLGHDALRSYLDGHPFFGCIVGRYANRIARGRFELDGETYTLPINNEPNHLHGGDEGFDKFAWEAAIIRAQDAVGVRLTHVSPDGDAGYPGEVRAEVHYWLTSTNELRVEFKATTDAPTHVNLTHHGYFNLNGHEAGEVADHLLTLHADRFTAVDDTLIPTGELAAVAGTPLDFSEPTAIGERIDSDHPQMELGGGYDHCFVVNRDAPGLVRAAEVYAPESGRVMEVLTTQPGVQLYTGNFLNGSDIGKGGHAYERRTGFCLETQHFPDSPNQPAFPTTRLDPGETYEHQAIYRFGTRDA